MRAVVLLTLLIACAEAPPRAPASDCRSTEPMTLGSARAVEPRYVTQTGKSGPSNRLVGATLIVDPEPGTTKELLQHRFDCSREAPLGVAGARAVVTSGDGSYRVAVTSDDNEEAREILRRAQALPR